jgi:uncharacterized protein (TIGR02594 family)
MLQKIIEFILSVLRVRTKPSAPQPVDDAAPKPIVDPPWMKLAKAELGVAEVPGDEDNPRVLAYYADAGHPQIDHDEVAWCSAFSSAMLERAGYASSKSLAARSYLPWGKELKKPKPGCIVVFSRGNPRGWQGHVGFYVGETATHIKVLGGNQSNKVSIALYSKSRVLGYRWPVTARNSRTNVSGVVGASASGATAAVIAGFSVGETLNIATTLKSLGDYWWLIFLALAISVFAHFFSMYARKDDLEKKGR